MSEPGFVCKGHGTQGTVRWTGSDGKGAHATLEGHGGEVQVRVYMLHGRPAVSIYMGGREAPTMQSIWQGFIDAEGRQALRDNPNRQWPEQAKEG